MSPNLSAFLHVIREGETSHDGTAYTLINGGSHFDAPPWVHPYAGQSAPPGKSAGAYQFIPHTWQRCAEALGLPDFSPPNQDAAAVFLIQQRGATADIEAGNLVAACAKLANEWVSLPGLGLQRVQRVFQEYGGGGAQPAPQPEEKPMGAILAFLPAILQMIPGLIGVFGKDGERAKENQNAAQLVADTFTKAVPGAVNLQDAVEKAQGDPGIAAAAHAAVMAEPGVIALTEVGGGVAAARKANMDFTLQATHWWQLVLNPVFLVTLLTLPLVYMFVWRLIQYLDKVSPDVISQTMGTVIGLVLGSIMGFWMGQTFQQHKNESTPQA